ncbi:hypothetical protein VNO77_36391 [Canavalia gladiata]|uniref:Uncharacterized protein n=1 Tax=Canavalia gladiata TaxID=3824 RepID=A0AAN9K941_CANGL
MTVMVVGWGQNCECVTNPAQTIAHVYTGKKKQYSMDFTSPKQTKLVAVRHAIATITSSFGFNVTCRKVRNYLSHTKFIKNCNVKHKSAS